jgi:hypothetical protein
MNILATLIVGIFVLVLFGWALRSCAVDARRRGKSPLLVVLLVLLFFPMGLIIWILFRPEPTVGSSGRRFRLNEHRVQ